MTTLRVVVALAMIFSVMVIANCSDIEESLSPLPENPFFNRFPDPCKSLNFPFSFPLPALINNFPPPIFSSLLPFPFSKPDFNFSPSLLTPPGPVEPPPTVPETLPSTVPEPCPAENTY